MLLFLFGKSENIALQKAKDWKIKNLKDLGISKNIVFVDKNIYSDDFATLATDISIFGDISAYFIKFKKDEILEEKQIQEMVFSQNLFVFFTQNEDLKELCEKVVVGLGRNLPKANFSLLEVNETFKEIFPSHFVNAIQKRDKKNSWKFLLELLSEKPAEEIYGVCIFALKSLLAAAKFKTNTANSGVKDFSFTNAKRNIKDRIKNFKGKYDEESMKEEIENFYFELIKLLPNSRKQNVGLGKALEKWILEN